MRGQLTELIDETFVPQSMIQWIVSFDAEFFMEIVRFRLITDIPLTDRQCLDQLHQVSDKIKSVKEQSFHDPIACQDVQDVLEKLRVKVPLIVFFSSSIIYTTFSFLSDDQSNSRIHSAENLSLLKTNGQWRSVAQ